jgi:hypothetical protein
MTAVQDYLKWRRSNPIGCMFARLIAIQPGKYKQVVECVPAGNGPAQTAQNISVRIDALIADRAVAAAALLFPEIKTLEGIARVMLALGGQPKWTVIPTVLDNEVVGQMVAIRVSREIPFGATTCQSEALVLGKFAAFPPTRKSPITALEIFIGEPLVNDPKTGEPTEKANLAHIDARSVLGDEPFDGVWDKSVAGRKESLGDRDDNRAKAKVTLVLTPALARRLGCSP